MALLVSLCARLLPQTGHDANACFALSLG